MKKMLLAAALLLPFSAYAQERVYTLTVTNSELGVIGTALSERPYKDVNAVITSIARQVQAQNAAEEQHARDEQKKFEELKKQADETAKAKGKIKPPVHDDKAADAPAEQHEGQKP